MSNQTCIGTRAHTHTHTHTRTHLTGSTGELCSPCSNHASASSSKSCTRGHGPMTQGSSSPWFFKKKSGKPPLPLDPFQSTNPNHPPGATRWLAGAQELRSWRYAIRERRSQEFCKRHRWLGAQGQTPGWGTGAVLSSHDRICKPFGALTGLGPEMEEDGKVPRIPPKWLAPPPRLPRKIHKYIHKQQISRNEKHNMKPSHSPQQQNKQLPATLAFLAATGIINGKLNQAQTPCHQTTKNEVIQNIACCWL